MKTRNPRLGAGNNSGLGVGFAGEFRDVPLSNVDLINWCKYLGVPIKGIFSRNEKKPLLYSPSIINMDDFGSLGTHWVCCWRGKNVEYLDSFGLPPLEEWERDMRKVGKETFLRNDSQIQAVDSVRCRYYCLLFLNERDKGTSFANILGRFSSDVRANKRAVKNYFLDIRQPHLEVEKWRPTV